MSAFATGIVGIIAFLVLLFFRMPIAFAMALVGFLGFWYMNSFSTAFSMVATELYANFSSYTLSVVPMFIWMGFLAFYSGIGTKLYSFAYKMIGHFPGGLAIATQVTCALFGAVCGSNTATAATIGAISLPEMKKYNYGTSLSTASVAAGGVLGILIPPSVIFIVYGIATEQSIGALFLAGIVPGIILMLLNIAVVLYLIRGNPAIAPRGQKSSWGERLSEVRGGLLEIMIVFALSVGGLFLGWFTPTEAGAVGAAGVLAVSAIGRKISWKGFKNSLDDTARTSAMIMLLIAGAVIFGRFIGISRIPFELANWAGNLPLPPFVIIGIIIIIYLVLGCIIDALALVLLTIPIFYPVAVDILGYDPIWFGVIIVLVVGMGVITPPVGMNVYIIKGVAKDVPLETIFRGIWPFLIAIIICILILMLFPDLALILVNVL